MERRDFNVESVASDELAIRSDFVSHLAKHWPKSIAMCRGESSEILRIASAASVPNGRRYGIVFSAVDITTTVVVMNVKRVSDVFQSGNIPGKPGYQPG
jgi:hypothetical protein